MYLRTLAAAALLSTAATASFAGGFAEPVIAPFVPAPAPAPEVRIHDWTGTYGGAFVSYARGDFDFDLGNLGNNNLDLDGGNIGLRLGYNRQIGMIVTGGDLSLSSGLETAGNRDLEALLTARGRIGRTFGQTGRTLGYLAGGLALGTFENSNDDVTVGYTAGIGLERALTDRLSIYGEVNYVALGDVQFNNVNGDADFTRINLGANFKF